MWIVTVRRWGVLVLAGAVAALVAQPARAATTYEFRSLFSVDAQLSTAGFSFPSINNHGTVAVRTFDGLYKHDGTTETFVTDFTTSGFLGVPWINDAGAIAGEASGRIVRIEPDGSITTLATLKNDGTGDFRGLSYFLVTMNDPGQAAAIVQTNDLNFAVVRLDGPGVTTIDTQDVNVRFNFQGPDVNDAGVVAFKAAEPFPNGTGLYTGSGGQVDKAGAFPSGVGSLGRGASINESGLVAGTEPTIAVTAQNGVVDIVGDGRPPATPYSGGFDAIALNDLGQVVFGAVERATGHFGLFTGPDPVKDKVVQVGDTVLGGVVTEIRFLTGGFNNRGQIVFLVQTGTQEAGDAVSHVVLATPVVSFLCYTTSDKRAVGVTLEDQFDGPAEYTGKKAIAFCTPSGGDPEGTHLKAYKITGPHARRTSVKVQNLLGTFFFDTVKTLTLMVPAGKSLPPDPPPGLPDPASADHYRCVKTRVKKNVCEDDPGVQCKTDQDCTDAGAAGPCNRGLPKGVVLTVDDQFGSRQVKIKAPTQLCVPTDKNGEGINDPATHLMCYSVRPDPKTRTRGVQATDQFGEAVLDLKKEAELCLSSVKTLP
jgi:hypothetical protein